eukprot:10113518-Lingulodinium_polyedra.AAC.1
MVAATWRVLPGYARQRPGVASPSGLSIVVSEGQVSGDGAEQVEASGSAIASSSSALPAVKQTPAVVSQL